ncbi:MAG: TonB-dependent receptor [Halieaceae bacterium]|nr:TonB-dependent receptor [Halieaceae bacterium]
MLAASDDPAAERSGANTVPALEEVVVTAELREVNWLRQPGSSSVLSGTVAARRNAVHLENLLRLTPNVNIAGGTSRARFYQVRGIGERSQFVEPLNPSVGVLIDDIDFSGLGAAALLYDIEQVEVLRGPQGTLHGANALAGLINLRSADPQDEFAARLNATLGDYGRRELGASLTGPLGDERLLYRVAAYGHRSDGFIDNAFLGRNDTNGRDELLLRGKLRWAPSATRQLDLTLLRADIDNGYDAFSLDNTRETLSDQPGRDRQQSDALGLRYTLVGPSVTTELLASAADTDSEYSYDEDWSFEGIAPGLEYSSFDRYLRQRRSYSVQARLRSSEPTPTGLGDLDWFGGVYALSDDERLHRAYTFASADFRSRFQADTIAAFGQLDLRLDERWSVGAGLRLARRSMDYTDSAEVGAAPQETLWGGKLSLSWEHEEIGLLYAAISRGYRAGGVNAGILAFPATGEEESQLRPLRFFDTESLYNLEIGHKGSFADGRLRSAVTLFYMDRAEQQVRGSLVIPRPGGSTAFVDFTDNAADGYNLGLEAELRARIGVALEVYLNAGLLRARFRDYTNADGRDLAGREQAHAPGYQFATGLSWRPLPSLLVDLQYEGRDAFYFSDRHDARSTAFGLVNLRLAWERERWELSLWARNLFDEDYFTRGFGSFGNDPRKGYVLEEYRQFGEPRQLAASLEFRF